MFWGDQIKDSASSHTSKQTLAYVRKQNMNFVTPQEWMPKSPDAALMDFAIWGIFKRRLQMRKIYTLAGLKRALRDEWRKLEQHVINKTLESWPKRCRLIYNLHGSQIEHLLQWNVFYVKFIDKIKLFQNSWITSGIRQGIEGLLARDSPELLFYVLLYSLLSTVKYKKTENRPHMTEKSVIGT